MSSKIDMVAGDYPVFVLGSNGFSGSSFVKSLIEQGINVRGYSRSPQPDHRFLPYSWITNKGNFEFVQLDLNRQLDYLLRDIVKFRPRVIANFAAQSMVGESWNTPEDWMQTNVVATASMVKAFASFDFLEKYIHFTTPEVYGSTNDWIPESFDFYPSTPYALSRATGDWLVRLWVENFDLPAVFTRAANIYGEGQQLYRIIPKTILFGMTNRKIPLHGGGCSIRSFVHMDDVSSALIKIIEKGEIPFVKIGSGIRIEKQSVYHFIEANSQYNGGCVELVSSLTGENVCNSISETASIKCPTSRQVDTRLDALLKPVTKP